MTLSFSTKWPTRMNELSDQPNYFVEKILLGLYNLSPRQIIELKKYYQKVPVHNSEFKSFIEAIHYRDILKPKIQTIRLDPHDRWKPGMKVHPVINNRTKNRFQFAQVLECVSTQKIEIKWRSLIEPAIWIDGHLLDHDEKTELAKNDGFPSFSAFMNFFNKDFTGKIIHWTDFKY